jgi:hypothetical protein
VLRHEGNLVHLYYFVLDDGELDEKAQTYEEPLGDYPPGSVCSYRTNRSGGVYSEDVTYERIWPDKDAVKEWTLRHGAVVASARAWESEELPDAFRCMAPVRSAYARLDEERQGLLLAQVVRYIVCADD